MKKRKIDDLLILIIPFAFYVFFALYDGPIWCDDSVTYVKYFGTREPLYPLCVVLFRTVFGTTNDSYLNILVVFQSLLLAYSTYSFVKYIKKEFNTSKTITIGMLLVFLSISLLCKYTAKRGSMYSNSILSESISYPLYILFIRYLIDYLINNKNKMFIICSVLSFLLISTRTQLYSSLILLVFSLIYVMIKNKEIKKGVIKICITCLLVFGANKTFDYCITYITSGNNSTHSGGSRFLTTMIVYTSSDEDINDIKDNEVRTLYKEAYDVCKENNYLKNDSSSWKDRVKHFKNNYDNIQLDVVTPIFMDYASSKTNGDVVALVDKYNNEIASSLLFKKLPDILSVFIDSFFAGLMITISADNSVFINYSIIAYLAYITLLVLIIKRNGINNKYSLMGLLTLLSIFVNVGIVSLVIFNQTRYTIYNMPLFYISGLLMLYNIFVNFRKEQ